MTKPAISVPAIAWRPRFRLYRGDDIALGPGKVDLLEQVDRRGSIAKAAQRLGMSYMRAWTLIRTMDGCFREPVVRALRGGQHGGGAALTATGKQVLRLYRRLEQQGLRATRPTARRLEALLRD